MKRVILFYSLAIFLIACDDEPKIDVQYKCDETNFNFYNEFTIQTILKSNKLSELSGLESSIANENMFWAHNDNSNENKLYLIDTLGEIVNDFDFGIASRDLEDMTIGPGQEDNKNYIYLGDIGDNEEVFSEKYIYVFEEPKTTTPYQNDDIILDNVKTIKFSLEDGIRDCEALMSDPVSKNLYLFSKNEEFVHLYELKFPFSFTDLNIARFIGIIPYDKISAADISSNGKEIIIKKGSKVMYWTLDSDESIVDIVNKQSFCLPYTEEPNGESICFDSFGKGYFTMSERKSGFDQELRFYKRK